jgi:hypothetical protein
VTAGVTAPTAANNGFTWKWHIDPQPDEEWLKFPSTSFFSLQNINSIEIGTYCRTNTIHKPQTLYGDLDQSALPGFEDQGCGPTAAVNSFVYLERAYPRVYQRKLIPDTNNNGQYDDQELIDVGLELANDYMKTDPATGTYDDMFIYGKSQYVEKMAPSTTVYDAQTHWTWGDHDPPKPPVSKPGWVTKVNPTWEFIYENLVACEDVEVLLSAGTLPSHYITLTGLQWLDSGNPGVVDNGEATLFFIDPDGGAAETVSIWQNTTLNALQVHYNGNDMFITMAVKESIPEPATLSLLALGLLTIGGLASARRKR